MTKTNDDKATTLWTLDPVHTTVGFSVRHLMVTQVRGVFERVSGTVSIVADHPEATLIDVQIPVDSVHTRDLQRDAHLRSADFFDAEHHPAITFRSTAVRVSGTDALEVQGNLTIRGTTREVTLHVVDVSGEQSDHNRRARRGASATAKIRRSDFGITFQKILETGGIAIADEVNLTLDVSLFQGDAP